jgi:O-antigen ligase
MKIKDSTLSAANSIFVILVISTFPLSIIFGPPAINASIILTIISGSYYLYREKSYHFFNKQIFYFAIIFWLYLVINSIFFNFSGNGLEKSFFYLRFILFSFFLFNLIKLLKEKIIFVYCIMFFITLFLASDIIFQFLNFTKYGNKDIFGFPAAMCSWNNSIKVDCERFSGFFNKELIAGNYLVLFGLTSIFLLTKLIKKNRIKILFFFFFISFFFVAIVISGERNAVLMSFIIILVNLIFNSEFRKILGFYIIKLMIIFSISFILLDHIKHRYYEYPSALFFQTQGEPLIHKVLNNQYGMHSLNAYSIFLDNKFLGSGVRSFRSECKKYSVEIITQKFASKLVKKADMRKLNNGCSTHPHNLYFELLAETGIFGLIFFLLFLSSIFIQKFSFLKNKTEISILASVLIALLFPLKPTGSIFSTMYSGYIWFFLAFYLAFIELKKTYYEK